MKPLLLAVGLARLQLRDATSPVGPEIPEMPELLPRAVSGRPEALLLTRAVALNATSASGNGTNASVDSNMTVSGSAPDLQPIPAVPAEATASAVGMHVAATVSDQVADLTDKDVLFNLAATFVLQIVDIEMIPNSLIGMPGEVLDPKNDHCLTVSGEDELKGKALAWSHCLHVDDDYDAKDVPAEQQWYLLPDGRAAWAVNASDASADCILKRSCNGATVYDVGDCNSPFAATFKTARSVANRNDLTQFTGTPLEAVSKGAGRFGDLHGPFQLWTQCDGVQTDHGCLQAVPKAGWTKLPSQYLGPNSFTTEDPPPVPPLPVQDMAEDGLDGDSQGAADRLTGTAFSSVDALAGVKVGMATTRDTARCGTWVEDGDRSLEWWYFIRVTDPTASAANATNATNATA